MTSNTGSNGNKEDGSTSSSTADETAKASSKRLQAIEAKAVAEATAEADNKYVPSVSSMNSSDPLAIVQQVDGFSDLTDYEEKESIYVGRSVPISAGGSLEIPLQVAMPGSVVEYAVENKQYDFGFSITAERDDSVTIVKEKAFVDANINGPITGKFLVGSVPCWIRFKFDNDHSWMREKVISYKVTVTPPSLETLYAGRRRRAKACLRAVEVDLTAADKRRKAAGDQLTLLETELEELRREVAQKSKSLQAVRDEEKWCTDRVKLRTEQKNLLGNRIQNGWEDEIDLEKKENGDGDGDGDGDNQ
mmetsp:Transcript_22194/g.48302  ORF Transcript_22194/g.48302 Transcript_22194/m.48302 type:complete len:305 (-) Transcript_22194:659-1573(-)|eukprot:CAMPEP_0168176370 /NCGR_PEP_ID=MMETSP0139_2-20121125/7743_1 /TAXON_ID=44445 /ORGANISM="Pseudo-nitzschia australis, Strain 10249 10 AB" /LENGTH=304 /DNA_ID=CAMNT_0008095067 /DNA_START=272 /DNA_END=1186 /DNA_ORIENTATION=+